MNTDLKRDAKVIFQKSGGTGHGITTRLTLPTAWVNALGATATDRGVEITLDPDNQEQIERMAKYLEKIKENA